MTRRRPMIRTLALAAATLGATLGSASAPSVDEAFTAYWNATSVPEAAKAAAAVVASGVRFDDAYARLRAGRTYQANVPRGVQKLTRSTDTGDFPFTVDVPPTYDPARKYQVRVQLHGGVMRPDPASRGDGSIGALAGAEQIYILPQSWAEAQWWAPPQGENVPAILDRVKRTYNVDENRVVMSGVSDGGTAAFYFAMRDSTPYASFLPLNGHILVLANRDLGLRGALFPHNLLNKPFFIVNGGKDRLYPAASVEALLTHFKGGGVDLDFRPQPEAGHNTAWWPEVKDAFEGFVREHARTPHPTRLTWQTDDTSTRNRAHWLVITRLGNARPGEALPDINEIRAGEEPNFGVRSIGMRLTSVQRGSNAEAFGFLPTDTVVSINGRDLPLGLELTEFMGLYQPGDALHFVVERGRERVDLKGVYQPTVMPRVRQLFATGLPTGRVDLVRDGNTVRASARGVGVFTLLLSPDVFDFSRPITVVADGKTVFSGMVQKSVETLLRWAARDNDRTMLYGAELPITLSP
jgi:pimeloyl-ACP methyl ester carboxylesterase